MKKIYLLLVLCCTVLFTHAQNSIIAGAVQGPLCAGGSVYVPISINGTLTGTNVLRLQMSDASGSFTNAVTIDSVVGTYSRSYMIGQVPASAAGTGYRFRVNSTSPAITGYDNGTNVVIAAIPTAPTISVNNICLSRDTLTITNATGAQSINWSIGSTLVQTYAAFTPTTIAGGNGQGSANNQFDDAMSIAKDSYGNIYVSDYLNNRVMGYGPGSTSATNGTIVAGGAGQGVSGSQLYGAAGIYIDGSNNLYVCDAYNNRIQRFPFGSGYGTNATTVQGVVNGFGNPVYIPVALVFDSLGIMYALESSDVVKFTSGGRVVVGTGLQYPNGMGIDRSGNIYVSEYNGQVMKFPYGSTNSSGTQVVGFGTTVNSAANGLGDPYDIKFDKAGNMYISDGNYNRVMKYAPGSVNGVVVAGGNGSGTGPYQLSGPTGILIDTANGTLYVVDENNNRVQKYTPSTLAARYVPTTPGTYTATYTTSAGCTSAPSNAVAVNQYCQLTLIDTTLSNACNGTNIGSVLLKAYSGKTPYQYKIAGGSYQSGSTYSNLAAGTYKFYVKDSLGAIDSATTTIYGSTPLVISAGVTNNLTTADAGAISLTVTGGTAPFHYNWLGLNNPFGNTDTANMSALPTGHYYVTVTDHNGCSAIDSSITINGPSNLTFTPRITTHTCYTGNDDTLTLVGSGGTPYTSSGQSYYLWGGLYLGWTTLSPSLVTGSGLGFNSMEDGNGVHYASWYRYNANISPVTVSASVTNTSGGLSNGAISLTATGGQTPFTYAWSGSAVTTSSRTALAAGTYTVTITDAGGCAVVKTLAVAGPPLMTDTITNVLCNGAATGVIAIHAYNGVTPYQYKIGNGSYQLSNRFTGLIAGTYTCYVKDSTGNIDSLSATVTQPTALIVTGTVTNTTGGLSNGSIVVTVSGGHVLYSYAWSGSSVTTGSRTALAAGAYVLTVTDGNGCMVVDTFHVAASSGNVLSLYMDTVAGSTGQTATIHVKVRNFKKIVSAQGTVQFTPSVITYSSLSQFGISSLNASDFGTTTASSGILSFAWSDPTLAGVTLADGTTLFAVTYNVVGTSGSSAVSLVSTPTLLEFADTSFNPIPYAVYPGLVTVNSSVTISGRIHAWAANEGVRRTIVSIAGATHTSVATDTSGKYSLTAIGGTADTITPAKNNDTVRANGVTTLDVLIVQRYILGTYALTGPYKLIAADVNSSGTITSLDYTLMQSLILGNSTTFPGNKLWTFVPSSYTFANPQSPWGFPTSRYYASAASQSGQDFIGIKLGDVNGDWNPATAKTEANNLTLYLPQTHTQHGQSITIPVKASGFQAISGMQFTLAWDSTQLLYAGIDSTSRLSVVSGSSAVSSGQLGVSWTDPNGTATTVPDDSTLFSVYFTVIGATGDSSVVSFDSSLVAVQFIDSNLNIINANLQSAKVYIASSNIDTAGIVTTGTDALSIYPNPATSDVIVDMGAHAGAAAVVVTDISGKAIYTKDISGQSTTAISVSGWAQGIYMIQVKYADTVRNIKLAVIHP